MYTVEQITGIPVQAWRWINATLTLDFSVPAMKMKKSQNEMKNCIFIKHCQTRKQLPILVGRYHPLVLSCSANRYI